jgi:hypothetical protein
MESLILKDNSEKYAIFILKGDGISNINKK